MCDLFFSREIAQDQDFVAKENTRISKFIEIIKCLRRFSELRPN